MLQGRKKIFLLLLFQVFLTFEFNAFYPSLKVCFFIPFIAYLIYEMRFLSLLWIAFISGLLFDSISSQYVLGAYTFSFTIATALAYRLKNLFFKDKILTLFFVSICLSWINTMIILLFFSNISLSTLTLKWLGIDFLIYPLIEGALAFIIYTLPPIVLSSLKLLKKPTEKHLYSGKRPQ